MDDLCAMAPAQQPLRPDEGAWPDAGITLTWHELRLLVALHLDQLGHTLGRVAPWDDAHRTAQAMRDGETPLRVSEVLDRPDPQAHPGLADDPTVDGLNLGPPRRKPHDDLEEPLMPPNVADDPLGPLVMHDPDGYRRWMERAAHHLGGILDLPPGVVPYHPARIVADLCSYAYQVGRADQRHQDRP